MQLMTFNSLLMFDVVFVFFLFLVGVTCLVYYLPPATRKSSSSLRSKKSAIEHSDIECGIRQQQQQQFHGTSELDEEIERVEDEESVHYYRQLVAHRHHRCPHHNHHHHHHYRRHQQELVEDEEQQQQQYYYDQQLHNHTFMNNRYMPVMTTPSPSSSSSNSSGGFVRSYLPVPSTPPPPPSTILAPDDDTEDEGNMEILPPMGQKRPTNQSSRHLYHNILNSAFEQHGDPYEDDDEFNMIATNVEILSSPVVGATTISTSLPASPDHHNNGGGGRRPADNSGETVINIDNQQDLQRRGRNNSGNHYHLPLHPRAECHSARHVVGICQYHMQQHMKSHQQQHQLHRLYQQQQLLQQFANQQRQVDGDGEEEEGQPQLTVSSPTTPILSSSFVGPVTPSIIQNPGSVPLELEQQKKVQYIVVDTTTDRNKKRPNKYCHVKAQNCDINRKGAAGPVDEV